MNRRHVIAVVISLLAILAALAQPLWIRTTGDEVALALRPVDPLSLFRGNYVDLAYDVDLPEDQSSENRYNDAAYVVFDDARPANALRVSTTQPALGPGERCIQGQFRGSGRISFPALEQFFVTPEDGARLETDLSSMVGIIKTTGSCRAILVALEPTRQP